MAGDKVNNYSQVDSDILALQLTADKTFKGYHQLTLTNYDNTTVPAIAAGSAVECNGALYKFDTEEAISTTDPVTSATVADGTVYVCIVPGATTCTAAFTATAPTWSDSKQGWYGTGGQANYRYAEYILIKNSTAYSKARLSDNKDIFYDSKLKITTSGAVALTATTMTQITGFSTNYSYSSTFSSDTITISRSGFYNLSGILLLDSNVTSSNDSVYLYIGVNSTPTAFDLSTTLVYSEIYGSNVSHGFSETFFFNSGDQIKFWGYARQASRSVNYLRICVNKI
jgi:hypothetical protein